MSQFKKNGTMELETSIGYSFSLIKTEYKQNKIYQNKKKTKRTVNLSFQSALCQQSERIFHGKIRFHCLFDFDRMNVPDFLCILLDRTVT